MTKSMKNILAIVLALGAYAPVGSIVFANPISESLNFDISLNDDASGITASYLSMFAPDSEELGKMIIEVKSDNDWLTVGDDWQVDDDVTVADGGSGDMEYHRISINVPCQKTGVQEFRMALVYTDRDGDVDIYDMHSETVTCTAAGAPEKDTEPVDEGMENPDGDENSSESDGSDDNEDGSVDDSADDADDADDANGADGENDGSGCSVASAGNRRVVQSLFQLLMSLW